MIQKSDTPVRSIVRKLTKQKQKITDNSSTGHGDVDNIDEYNPGFNPYASQTHGYDSGIINETPDNESVDFTKITCPSVEESFSKPANEKWAEIILDNWNTKRINEKLRSILEKHKSPENCQIKAPTVNSEIWKLLNSWQRKGDVKVSAIQKSMIKSLNTSLSIVKHIQKGKIDLQFVAQTTADIVAMLQENLARKILKHHNLALR